MMDSKLSKEVLEREIEGARAAVKSHKEGALVNQVVLDAFKEQLKLLIKNKKFK